MTETELGSLETEMNRGFLQILVYSMIKHIEGLGYKIEENTLYPLLRRLEKNGWIAGRWTLGEDRPRKFYGITAEGRTMKAGLLAVWKNQNRILEEIEKENEHDQ